MSEVITIGDPSLSDETLYCPNCGVRIEYSNFPPSYCPKCGAYIEVSKEQL